MYTVEIRSSRSNVTHVTMYHQRMVNGAKMNKWQCVTVSSISCKEKPFILALFSSLQILTCGSVSTDQHVSSTSLVSGVDTLQHVQHLLSALIRKKRYKYAILPLLESQRVKFCLNANDRSDDTESHKCDDNATTEES